MRESNFYQLSFEAETTFRIAPSFQTEPPPRALFKLSPYYNKKEEILIELPLLIGVADGTRTHDIQNHNLTL